MSIIGYQDLTGGFDQFFKGNAQSYINSIQQVSITIASGSTSNTATITGVGSNAFIIYQGQTTSQTSTNNSQTALVQLTNSTTVTATRNASNSDTVTINAVVIDPASSLVSGVRQGTISITSTSMSNTATISSVTTSRSAVFFLGSYSSVSNPTSFQCGVTLTNSTTVTAFRNSGDSGTSVVGYVVVEFSSGVIQSNQQFSSADTAASTTTTQTISSVNTSNSLIAYGGFTGGSGNISLLNTYLTLSNSTTVTITKYSANATTRTTYYAVLEFVSGVLANAQRGSISVSSATSNTATISSAATNKSFANYVGASFTGTTPDQSESRLTQTNTTTLTANKNTAGTTTSVVGYEVPTFN